MKRTIQLLALWALLLGPTCAAAQAPAPDPVAQAIAAYQAARDALLAQKVAVIAAAAKEREESAARLAKLAAAEKAIDEALGSVPGPKPPEPPGPLTPGAEVVADLLSTKVAAYPGKAATAARLAAVYRAQATSIQQQDPAATIVQRTGQAVVAALGGEVAQWRGFFDSGLRPWLNRLAAEGKLANAEDHRRTWLTIAEGLEAGAK